MTPDEQIAEEIAIIVAELDKAVLTNHLNKLKTAGHVIDKTNLVLVVQVQKRENDTFVNGEMIYNNRVHFNVPVDQVDAYIACIGEFISNIQKGL